MSKINETIVMMAEQKEQFEINGKKFQIIEVKEAEQQPDYSHLVGKYAKWGNVNCCKILRVTDIEFFVEYHGEEFYKGYPFSDIGDTIEILDTNPDEKKVWEKANEAMWEYEVMATFDIQYTTTSFKQQFRKEWKHIRAYLFLSKFADLCNEGVVVDWTDDETKKYVVDAHENHFSSQWCSNTRHHIAFLDFEARDYSLKVHEQIWKDYWGIE